jgi:hypothetical protein
MRDYYINLHLIHRHVLRVKCWIVSVDGEGAYVSVPGVSANRISVFVEALGLKEFKYSLHVRFIKKRTDINHFLSIM